MKIALSTVAFNQSSSSMQIQIGLFLPELVCFSALLSQDYRVLSLVCLQPMNASQVVALCNDGTASGTAAVPPTQDLRISVHIFI